MSNTDDLIKAVRSGQLDAVRAVLDAGAAVELNDGQGVPGLPLGIACFLGHAEIVRELVRRGAKVNLADNREPISPLSMAIRGGRTDVVRLLVELGATVPPGMQTGLSAHDLIAAQWVAKRAGDASVGELEIEEIVMPRAFGTDTTVLEADVIRAAIEAEERKKNR
ncbi:MAG: ankyrin repeat domain-containing protein [Rhodocyclales bacterium]|nr:ankyrin repeat domain-containing protein [Rhodocyclales bacterium]